MKQLLLTMLCLFMLVGCKATTINQVQLAKEIDAIYANTMHRGVFYAGSDAEYHYFVTKWELRQDKLFKVSQTSFVLPATFAPTKKQDQWLSMGSFEEQECNECQLAFTANGHRYFVDVTSTN